MFTLTMQTDNAAFEDDLTGEIKRILTEIARKVDGKASLPALSATSTATASGPGR